jgi:ketosteroid isomerase-like protein
VWDGSVVHKVVGADVAMAVVKYQYRTKPEDAPVMTWLTYVFQLQDGQWRIVHDQNTALDFAAFARMAGIEIK